MAKKSKLGHGLEAATQGLDAIFGENITDLLEDIQHNNTSATEINVNEIKPNPYQPRKRFDDKSLKIRAE